MWATSAIPRGWEPHFVRHEMIHHLQAERLSTLTLLLKPRWFVEGMACALSDDPREPLAGSEATLRGSLFSFVLKFINSG